LGNLLGHEGKRAEAIELLRRAIQIHEGLIQANSENREYKLELAKYYNNLSLQLWYEDENDEAQQRNHQAVDLMEQLVSPSVTLNKERARMHMTYGMLGSPGTPQKAGNHPEFHVLYRNLAASYVEIARQYLKSDKPEGAEEALKSLLRVLPQVSQEERKELLKTYDDLERQLTSRKAHDN